MAVWITNRETEKCSRGRSGIQSPGLGRVSLESLDVHQQLVLAIGDHDMETVRSLMKQGVDPNISGEASGWWGDWGQQFPLCWAAKCGSVEAVKVLLDHGAKVSIHNNNEGDSDTALCCAVKSGVAEIVRMLLD